jgi:neutral ceramidase
MFAGADRTDITPKYDVLMEGMIREHKSEGVHDHIYARTLLISNDSGGHDGIVIVSLDICVIGTNAVRLAKQAIFDQTGISPENVIIAATHNHSGPATFGIFQPAEDKYVSELIGLIAVSVQKAQKKIRPAKVICAEGREDTISHYRRFHDDQGKIVMYWEQDPAEGKIKALGEPDPSLGVIRVIDAENNKPIAVLFNHTGHPNVMSGENYLISGDYTGAASRILEERLGCTALFVNGAQGSVDMDNWRFRDWDGVDILGGCLANAVMAAEVSPVPDAIIKHAYIKYILPRRQVTNEELAWADDVFKKTGGSFAAVADGVGDDYKATLYKKIYALRDENIEIEQIAFSIGNTAFISFPGELFTEIGLKIKSRSPFANTHIIGLANGYAGYIPTPEAIGQGGYEVETRHVDEMAARMIEDTSIKLLEELNGGKNV